MGEDATYFPPIPIIQFFGFIRRSIKDGLGGPRCLQKSRYFVPVELDPLFSCTYFGYVGEVLSKVGYLCDTLVAITLTIILYIQFHKEIGLCPSKATWLLDFGMKAIKVELKVPTFFHWLLIYQ